MLRVGVGGGLSSRVGMSVRRASPPEGVGREGLSARRGGGEGGAECEERGWAGRG